MTRTIPSRRWTISQSVPSLRAVNMLSSRSCSEPMPIRVILHVFVFLLSGFCYCNSSPIPGQPQPVKSLNAVLSTMDPAELLDLLGESPQSPDEISSGQENLLGCDATPELTVALRRFLQHVDGARAKASIRSQSSWNFKIVLQSPQRLLTYFQDLFKELKSVLNCLGRRCPLKEIPSVGSTFQNWYRTVQETVRLLQDVDTVTASALPWLQTVYQNLDQQTRAFNSLSKDVQSNVCAWKNDSAWTNDSVKLTDALDNVTTGYFLHQKARMDARWAKNKKLLFRVSRHIVELDLIFYTVYDIQSTLQTVKTLRSTVLKPMNKHFRQLQNFLSLHTAYADQLFNILVKNLTGNWKLAVTESIYRTFLDNVTAVEQQQLDNHMVGLRERLKDLQTALREMKSSAFDAIDYLGSNNSRYPPAFSLLDNLSRALKVLLDKAHPMTDGNEVKTKVLNQIQTLSS